MSTPPTGQGRRPRAPTITIDTSAVGRSSENLVQPEQDHSLATSSPMLRPTSTGQSTPPELRQSASFESRESRPTSPHNISSPQQINHPQNFLSVPVQRKRGGSEGGDTISTTDTTYLSTDSQSKAFGADDVRHGAGDHPVLPDKEALIPDPGTEARCIKLSLTIDPSPPTHLREQRQACSSDRKPKTATALAHIR